MYTAHLTKLYLKMSVHKTWKVEPGNEISDLLYEKFTYPATGWMEVGENRTFLGPRYQTIMDDIENLNVTDEDIFVISFPRSGQ